MLGTISKNQLSGKKYQFVISCGQPLGSATIIKARELNVINIIKLPLPQLSWVLDDITIKEEFRGMGYGTQLLQFVIQESQAIASLPIVLMPPKSEYMGRILGWYKRYGFEPTPKHYLQLSPNEKGLRPKSKPF